MKRPIFLLAVVLLLAALIVLYCCVLSRPGDTDSVSDPADAGDHIVVSDADYTEVTALSFTYDGETNDLVCEDGTWYLAADRSFPQSQEVAVKMAWAISDIAATRRVAERDTADLAEFGLDMPQITVEVTYGSGTVRHYDIGRLNTFNDSRYLMERESGAIYNIASALAPYFEYHRFDMIACDAIPAIEPSVVQSVEWETADGIRTLDDPNVVARLLEALAFDGCVSYHGGEADEQAAFGIGAKEESTLTIRYIEEKAVNGENANISSTANIKLERALVIRIGTAEGKQYAMQADSSFIHGFSLDPAAFFSE